MAQGASATSQVDRIIDNLDAAMKRLGALKLPRANGKTASIGFCAGGSNSFRFAGDVPALLPPSCTTAARQMKPSWPRFKLRSSVSTEKTTRG